MEVFLYKLAPILVKKEVGKVSRNHFDTVFNPIVVLFYMNQVMPCIVGHILNYSFC